MIPESLAGLVVFVALLTPGFVYLQARERRHPGIDYSALRETSLVVVVSIATLSISAMGLSVLRALRPDETPDIGSYVRLGSSHLREHYVEAAVWGGSLILAASSVAYLWAVPPSWVGQWQRLRPWVAERRGLGVIHQRSGWSAAFEQNPHTIKVLNVTLDDDSVVFGRLASHSTQIAETADRDLALIAPLKIRAPGGDQFVDLSTAGMLVLSASRIKYFTVGYEAVDAEAEAPRRRKSRRSTKSGEP